MTKPNEPTPRARGWLVKADSGYYTGKGRSALERWSNFPKFAKIYQRKRWAQTMADRLGARQAKAHSP